MNIMRYGGSPWRHLKLAPIAKDVRFDNERMYILLADERELSIPLKWFPILLNATPDQRSRWELSNNGTELRWDKLMRILG